MAFWNKFPYSNFHEINLDWIIREMKKISASVTDFARQWEKALKQETGERQEADRQLQENLNTEAEARIDADNALRDLINTEATSRMEADKALQANLDKEASQRLQDDNALRDMINNEALARVDADNALQGQLNNLYNNMVAGDQALQNALDTEATARVEADKQLQANLDAEASTRQQVDEELRGLINKEIEDRTSAVNAEATARAEADDALRELINTEATARTDADDALRELINTETERATAAEEALGERIDGIEGELDGISGPESPFIRKDGTTTTTGKIPLAMGGTSETDPAAETDLVNLRSMQAADEAIQQAMTEYVDNQLESVTADIHSIPAGGTAGQVLSKVDNIDYNTQWIEPPSGSDPDAIKKDGTTTTTAPIPFEHGIIGGSTNTATMRPTANSPTGVTVGETTLDIRLAGQGGALDKAVGMNADGLYIRPGTPAKAGQVLTATNVDGYAEWRDGPVTFTVDVGESVNFTFVKISNFPGVSGSWVYVYSKDTDAGSVDIDVTTAAGSIFRGLSDSRLPDSVPVGFRPLDYTHTITRPLGDNTNVWGTCSLSFDFGGGVSLDIRAWAASSTAGATVLVWGNQTLIGAYHL